MKKSVVWAVLLGVVLTLDSCKEKDPEPVSPLVGTWSRVEYEFTGLPTGFTKYWEGHKESSWGESNFIFVFNSDGTYTRTFTLPSPYNLNDKGKWTLEGSALKVSPDSANDLDLIDNLESQNAFPGLEFTVEGEISDIRVELSRVITFGLPSDAAIDAAIASGEDIPEDQYKPVEVTVIYKFNKLK